VAKVLIVGCGDIGERVARRLLAADHEVLGWVRSQESAARLQHAGIAALSLDLDQTPDLADDRLSYQRILYLAPPQPAGESDQRLQRLLDALPGQGIERFVYISTSGVYGDCEGAWVDESWPAKPQTARAKRRWQAEQILTAWAQAQQVSQAVLRVPGIYGPARLPLERLRRGAPLVHPEQAPYSNRIHADDLASVCLAALAPEAPTGVFNCCDDQPTTMTDYFLRIAEYVGLPQPRFIDLSEAEAELGSAMASFLAESRRMRNQRLHDELGVRLQYPDLDAGLSAIFAADPNYA